MLCVRVVSRLNLWSMAMCCFVWRVSVVSACWRLEVWVAVEEADQRFGPEPSSTLRTFKQHPACLTHRPPDFDNGDHFWNTWRPQVTHFPCQNTFFFCLYTSFRSSANYKHTLWYSNHSLCSPNYGLVQYTLFASLIIDTCLELAGISDDQGQSELIINICFFLWTCCPSFFLFFFDACSTQLTGTGST